MRQIISSPANNGLNTETISIIERACTRLVYAYARYIDFRDYEGFAALFAPEGVLDTAQALEGRDAIAASLKKRPDELRSRHVMSNVQIEPLSASSARGISYLTLFRYHGEESLKAGPVPLTQPAAVGHYEDRFVKLTNGWHFERRKLHLAMADKAQF